MSDRCPICRSKLEEYKAINKLLDSLIRAKYPIIYQNQINATNRERVEKCKFNNAYNIILFSQC